MRGYSQAQLVEAFGHLGVTPQDFAGVRASHSLPEAQNKLDTLRDRVKKRWKRLAFELHPDRTEGDEDKEKLFKLLAGVVGELEKAKILPPRRPPPMRVVVQPFMWTNTATTSTATSTWGSSGMPAQVWVNGRRVQ